jgi:hypothetical protein
VARQDSKAKTKVELPPADGNTGHRKVALLAALGFALGLSWPTLAGKHIGPQVPGAKSEPSEEAPAASASASARPAASAVNSGAAEPSASVAASAAPAKNQQKVVVDAGTILTCWKGKEKIDGEQCGKLKLDRTIVPLLEQLGSCPSALGLTGDLEITIDIDFDKKSIHVKRGKRAAAKADPDKKEGKAPKSNELPGTTVSGILACVADYVREVQADKIPHEKSRYSVQFALHFFAPGAAPQPKTEEETPTAEPEDGDVATIAWDSALLRDEPRTGKVVARLVRGTRVKILGGRKDWYEVKMGNRQGWLYRSAVGR